jgi:regulatory protein
MTQTAPRNDDVNEWPQRLQSWALFYLQRYACSRARVSQYLVRKIKAAAPGDAELLERLLARDIPALLDRYEELGYINDNAYASAFAKSLMRSGRSQSFIAGKLREKGVPPAIIQTLLVNLQEEHGTAIKLGAAVRLMQKKRLGCYAVRDVPIERQIASLARAGFDFHTIQQALRLDREVADDIIAALQAI